MRRTLVSLLAFATLLLFAGPALADGNDGANGGNNGGNSSGHGSGGKGSDGSSPGTTHNNKGGTSSNVQIGPNAKLSNDKHTITFAVQVRCSSGDDRVVLAKAKQGDAAGKGSKDVACAKGQTKNVTVDVKDSAHEFKTGKTDACVAAPKKGKEKNADPTCKKVDVIT